MSQIAPGQVWIFLQYAHDPKMGVFLDLGLSASHMVRVMVVIVKVTKCFGQATTKPCRDMQLRFGGFYNPVRRHKHLDQLRPLEFERRQIAL